MPTPATTETNVSVRRGLRGPPRRWARPWVAVFSLVVAVSVEASAMEPGPVELKARGDASFDARNYADALEEYGAAFARGGDPRLRYNIAQTLTALERYPEALASYQAFLAEAPTGTLNAAQQEKFFALLDELKAKIARVDVRCPASGARVLVREVAVGTTPLAGPLPVNAGPARIEVLAEGFKPFVLDVTLAGGEARVVDVSLERIDFTGALSVRSSVVGAHVTIDAEARGVAPLAVRLEQGAHVVGVSAPGYREQEKTVAVEPGGHTSLLFSLPRSPDYTLAYAGFGAGVVGIGAGAATGILAFTTLGSAKAQCDIGTKQCGPAGQPDLHASLTYGVFSTAAFAVGAAGVGVGVFGVLRARQALSLAKPVEIVLHPHRITVEGVF